MYAKGIMSRNPTKDRPADLRETSNRCDAFEPTGIVLIRMANAIQRAHEVRVGL